MCRWPFLHARASRRVTVVDGSPPPAISGTNSSTNPTCPVPATTDRDTGIRCTGTTTTPSCGIVTRRPVPSSTNHRFTARARALPSRAHVSPLSPRHAYSVPTYIRLSRRAGRARAIPGRAAAAAWPACARRWPCVAVAGGETATAAEKGVPAVELSRPWARSVAGKTTRWKGGGRAKERRGRSAVAGRGESRGLGEWS